MVAASFMLAPLRRTVVLTARADSPAVKCNYVPRSRLLGANSLLPISGRRENRGLGSRVRTHLRGRWQGKLYLSHVHGGIVEKRWFRFGSRALYGRAKLLLSRGGLFGVSAFERERKCRNLASGYPLRSHPEAPQNPSRPCPAGLRSRLTGPGVTRARTASYANSHPPRGARPPPPPRWL